MDIGEIISLCAGSLSVLISIVVNIISVTRKNKKATVLSILSNVATYVSEAEEVFGAGNGKAKLTYVLNKVQIDSVKANVDISDETITAKVESVLATPQKKESQSRTDVQE